MSKGEWQIFDAELKSTAVKQSGVGLSSLCAALPANAPAWATYRYDEAYNVRIKYRPAAAPGLKKTLANQSEQSFLDLCGDKTKVTVEVLSNDPKVFSDAAIWECIRPGSGTKVIDGGNSSVASSYFPPPSSTSPAPAPAPSKPAPAAPSTSSASATNGPKFCGSCGAKNTGGKFCANCGGKY